MAVKVSIDAMRRALDAMESTVSSAQAKFSSTGDTVRSLSSTWTGAAATGFYRAEVSWEENCQQILRAMEDLMQKVQSQASQYRGTEELTQDQATQLQNDFAGLAL